MSTLWIHPKAEIAVTLPNQSTESEAVSQRTLQFSVDSWVSIYLMLQADPVFMAEVERRST
jgi:hypothetical protein